MFELDDEGFEGVICSGFDMCCALHGCLPDGVAFAVRMSFDDILGEIDDWGPERVGVAMGGGHPLFPGILWSWGQTIYVPWGLFDTVEETDLTQPAVFAALCHEIYHCWQFARDGILNMARRVLRPRYWSERRWHDQDFEREAVSFECAVRDHWGDPMNAPMLRTLIRGPECEATQRELDDITLSARLAVTYGKERR
jgi:hypothetical protein